MLKERQKQKEWDDFFTRVQDALGCSQDLVFREVMVSGVVPIQCMYLESLVETRMVDLYILRSYMENQFTEVEHKRTDGDAFIIDLPFYTSPREQLVQKTVQGLLEGRCMLADSNANLIRLMVVAAPKFRPIEEAKSEPTIRGPHEGLTENIEVNIGLIRKRIRTQQFRMEKLTLGDKTKTRIVLMYMDGITPEMLVQEARSKLQSIKIDSVLETAYLEEYLQDNTWSPFPTMRFTERPDVVAAELLQGKVAIAVDGTPDILIAPMTFFEFFNSPEDYYQRADIASLLRLLRLLSFVIAVFVPSIFVAITSFHQELIPAELLIALSTQREGVPFPTLLEVLIMEVLFEIIREAGIRMPRAIGQAVSILGAIVLGQAAVDAGLVSAAVVIVVAITGIANFVVPVYSFGIAQRLIRFTFVMLAGFMGLFGILCGILFLVAHLTSLRSFSIPYFAPVTPAFFSDWKDTIFRFPRPQLNKTIPSYFRNLFRMKK